MVLKEKKAIRQATGPEEPRREWGPFKTGSAGKNPKYPHDSRESQADGLSAGDGETMEKKPNRMWLLLAAMGPGIVTAMAGNDAGGISTYSTVGAKFGFATLWVIPIMCVLLIVVEMTAARMGAVTGKGFAALIRERFGIRLTASVSYTHLTLPTT